MSSGAQLILLHDDGKPEINIVVHGYSPLDTYPAFGDLAHRINDAELGGRVYLFFWKSGNWKAPGLSYFEAKAKAEEMGRALYRSLSHIGQSASWPITLIGHSLGARVLYWFLDAVTRERFRIQNVILLGGAVDSDAGEWEERAHVVHGEIVNVFSNHDSSLRRWRGLGNPVGLIPIESNLQKVRDFRCHLDHMDYFPSFNWIISKALPKRRRSKGFQGAVRVECPGLECASDLIVIANTEVTCPDCKTDFWYAPESGDCFWHHRPKRVGCSFSCGGAIYVQGSGRYQCPDCRRWDEFKRVENKVSRS